MHKIKAYAYIYVYMYAHTQYIIVCMYKFIHGYIHIYGRPCGVCD